MVTALGGFESLDLELWGGPYRLVARGYEPALAPGVFEAVELPTASLRAALFEALQNPGGAHQIAALLEQPLPRDLAAQRHLADALVELVECGRAQLLRDTRSRMADLAPPELPELEDEDAAEQLDWIEIVVEDEAGRRLANIPYELTLPDGATRRGRTNRQGVARYERILSGQCTLSLIQHDREAWALG
ncbi:hypothetical protein G6O69_14320 [Pseudenhygromyxa sp. WMMC2535]|uniref:hypothetical protein n=1 Tax=Pseudenhygromyxa sp. WMMC2535 TaxID=2712867 RepID=UPI0015532FDF|nr:hypothetical protein [Pseudenhygromyxa sp. WMMC2535]NVB39014.1 hypothetical protein [Pseudenhygromyxa sp. WMMC2535]